MKKADDYIGYVLVKIIYIVIIPIILYDLLLIIQSVINPDITPNIFGVKTFNIVSGSMEPEIEIDDIIVVKDVPKEEINKNDIITFKIDGEVITHRIIEVEKNEGKYIYTTKGDSNEVTDIEKIEYSQIEGKYIGKISKIGKVLNFFKNKVVFTIIVAILIISFVFEKKKMKKKIKRKEKRIAWEEKQIENKSKKEME